MNGKASDCTILFIFSYFRTLCDHEPTLSLYPQKPLAQLRYSVIVSSSSIVILGHNIQIPPALSPYTMETPHYTSIPLPHTSPRLVPMPINTDCETLIPALLLLTVDAATWHILKGHNLPRIIRPGARSPVRRPSKCLCGISLVEVPCSIPAWSWIGLRGGCFVLGLVTRDIAGRWFPSLFGLSYSHWSSDKCSVQSINAQLVSAVSL